MKIKKLIGVIFVITPFLLFSQSESGYGFKSDSTESDYQNLDELGGPKTIGAQLRVDNQKKESYFRVGTPVTDPWFAWKKKLQEKTGIQLGINYTSLYMRSSSVMDEANGNPNTASGILDIQVGWNLVGRKSGKNKGTLFFKMNSRHAYGDLTNPMFHGIFESGYYGLPGTGFNDYSFRTLELNWQQSLANDKITVVLGKIDVTNYLNFHGLVIPWSSFLGYGSSLTGTINWPNQGLGAAFGIKWTDQFYTIATWADVYGDNFAEDNFLDFGENFFNGDYFTAVELGYVPSMAERYFKKISVTFWNTSPYTSLAGNPVASSKGIAFSSHWFFQERFAPYFRFAFSDGNGENAFYKKDLQIGHGFVFRSHDLLGTSFSWAETNIPDTDNQMTMEVYYRVQLSSRLAVTPDFQWIINPTFSGNSSLTYWGVRIRGTL